MYTWEKPFAKLVANLRRFAPIILPELIIKLHVDETIDKRSVTSQKFTFVKLLYWMAKSAFYCKLAGRYMHL